MNKFHRLCIRCKRAFAFERKDQEQCIECQNTPTPDEKNEFYKNIQSSWNKKTCKQCDQIFYADCANVICWHCKEKSHKHVKYYSNATKTVRKDNIEKFLKEKKKRKGIPLEELIRRQEYQRVYGKDAWDHYCKGRKWDKI